MKNILSIDFDIIMAPSINLYNDIVPKQNWDELLKILPNLTTTPANLFHYNKIALWLYGNIKQDTEIYIAYSHKNILDFLANDSDLNITNIDHHHDIAYNKHDFNNLCNEGTCANWVKWLYEHNQLSQYIWVNNDNSKSYEHEIKFPIQTINFKNFQFQEYDKVFLCLSPEWIPPYYHTLFYSILDTLNQLNDYHLEIHI